jgi:hypothetical protein
MDLKELEDYISIMLSQLRVTFKKLNLIRGISTQFVIEDFGLIICGINRIDYAQVNDTIIKNYPDWRIVYVTTNDNIVEKKDEILWNLMRCGYMKWLRYTFPRQIKSIINGTENLGQKIIRERLRIWADKPKYKFLINDNKIALENGMLRELTNDPSFFDYMPEER